MMFINLFIQYLYYERSYQNFGTESYHLPVPA